MNVLNALYWFNPLVWLAVRMINKDMETACDAVVLSHIGLEKRQGYIETIIQFAGSSDGKRLQPALCMNDGRVKLKKRIKGMFLNNKTKATIKIPVLILALVMAFACFTTACQPTPETPVVINKNDGKLEEKFAQTEAPEAKYEAPQMWEDNFTRGKLTVNIKAEPQVPEVSAYPVVKMKYVPFSQEDVNRFADVLMQGQKLYKTNHPPTKAELEKELIMAKQTLQRKIEDPESHGDSVEDMQNGIKNLEERIKAAPETVLKEYVEPVLEKQSIETEKGAVIESCDTIAVSADLPGYDYSATLQVYNYAAYSRMEFQNGRFYQSLYDPAATQAKNLKTTMEEAIGSAKTLANQLGVTDMEVVKAEVGLALPYRDEREDQEPWDYEQSKEQQGYIIHLRRVHAGIPVTYNPEQGAGYAANLITEEYAQTLPMEYFKVYIDDTGITGVIWEGRMTIDGVVSQNVQLLPFDAVAESFKKNLFVSNAWTEEDESLLARGIDIDSAVLGYFCTAIKNEPGEYLLTPVWDFNGAQTSKNDIEKVLLNFDEKDREAIRKQAERENDLVYRDEFSILTINAIDGSIIDRMLGY